MRLIVKGTLTLFLLLLISIPLSAQYVVQGVVTDSLTKEPLPYASVRLKDTTEGTTTGSDGRFYFKTNRSEAILVISVIGYNENSRRIYPARNLSFTNGSNCISSMKCPPQELMRQTFVFLLLFIFLVMVLFPTF